ncbi:hypothetical protein AGR7C_Lc140153 [Agrobacterium deltaense Zutra 3/1]|uniref:Uncharacterized protein n=2 Tax=Rhizobium/Agrobacterium group TaxID=227290 RepID=A0A1S7RB81_9HYPH|nr:hypothetical protein AGR7C_Lc140153 [Agrobacterium deltaense Zutra 3/1]
MKAMSLIGSAPGEDAQILACMSFAEIQAIDAKVGEAARTSQPVTSHDRSVSEERFLVGLDIAISEFPIEVRQCFLRRLT